MAKFRELTAWQHAHALTLEVYRQTRRLPRDEQFGLTSQIRRAAVSIGANLAEGSNQTAASFAHYISQGIGSANELEYLLLVAVELELSIDGALVDRAAHVAAKLQRLRSHVLRARGAGLRPDREAGNRS
jgi:four helix bundle protein